MREEKPTRKVRVLGVQHYSFFPVSQPGTYREKLEFSKQLRALLPHLDELRGSNAAIGVERLQTRPPTKPREDGVLAGQENYWKGVLTKSRSRGIKVLPLEDDAVGSVLLRANIAASNTACFSSSRAADYAEYFEKKLRTAPHTVGITADKAARITQTVWRHLCSDKPEGGLGHALYSLSNALSFERSLHMCEQALKQGASHVVIGSQHAADLKLAGKAEHTLVGEAAGYAEYGAAQALICKAAHERFKPLIEEIKRIASE